MRVCQFRHFGLVFQGLAGRQEISGSPYSYKDTRCCQHLDLKELLLWSIALSVFNRFAIVVGASILRFHS
jgi:hypothetical protein